jgi:hypothetical protein
MHQKTMDDRPYTAENICYMLFMMLYNMTMLMFIMFKCVFDSVDWRWACTQCTRVLRFLASGFFHVFVKIFYMACVHLIPTVVTSCVLAGILACTFPAIFGGLCKVLYDWFLTFKKADNVIEDLHNDYPYIKYAICTFVATGIVAIFLYRCLRCATEKTKNMHMENKTTVNATKNKTINRAGDTHNNTQNTQNTSVNDHRNIQINLKYINMQLPMQLMDPQITAKNPTRKSPRGKSPRHIRM